jgi:tRNA G18 (ribose-2'-O)-methylase SpoU
MGAVLGVPWTRTGTDPLADLAGFTTIALTPAADAIDLSDVPGDLGRRAVMLGTEGDGLADDVAAGANLRVRIPMADGVDSLNVAAASAIALYALAPRP